MAIFIMRGAFNQFLPTGTQVITQISPPVLPLVARMYFCELWGQVPECLASRESMSSPTP
jgi:hypothetical protein